MAGRCNCSSVNATGASLTAGSDCVSVTGAGTPASPAVIDVVVDPSASNNLQCGPGGLFAATAQLVDGDCTDVSGDGSLATPYIVDVEIDPDASNVLTCGASGLLVPATQLEDGDCTTVTGDGSVATPYAVAVELDPNARNLLDCGAPGLMATPDPLYGQSSGAYLGGAAPLTGLIKYTGQTVVMTDAGGVGIITLPAAFPTGFVNVIHSLGDIPTSTIAETAVDAATVTLGSFRIRARDETGAAVAAASLRYCWEATGW